MGGACTAIVDDVDMLTANPAGATRIEDTTFNFQLRYADLETVNLDQDVFDSEFLGTRPGQLYKPLDDQSVNISFAGMSKPFGQWTLSVFYQQRLEFQGNLDIEEVFDVPGDHLFTNRNALAVSLEGLGISAAYQFSDAWSVGLSVVNAELDLQVEDTWQISSLSGNPVLQSDFDMILLGNRISDKVTDTLLSVGILYQPEGRFSYGFTYSQGGEFGFSSQSVQQFRQNDVILDTSTPTSTTISLADTLSVGVGWRPSQSLLFSLDIEWSKHSDLPALRNQSLGLNLSMEEFIEPIKDTTSIKLGFEKRFSPRGDSGNRYVIRAGAFTEQDHDGLRLVEGDDTHFTLGFGAIFSNHNRFRLELGIEVGDEEKTLITSLGYALH
jgi:long-subunit fatty acid transport protein